MTNPKTIADTGYSLVEVVIAIGILAIIMVLATGILSRFMFVQRHDIAQQALQEDTRFALELVSREARSGYGSTFLLGNGSGDSFMFRNQNGDCVMYRLDKKTKQLQRGQTNPDGDLCRHDDFAQSTFAAITSPDSLIQSLKFIPTTSEVTPEGLPDRQGIVTIVATFASRRFSDVSLTIQSTVSSRQTTIFKKSAL